MPRYAYRCGTCEEEFLTIHSSDELLDVCDKCGASGELQKLLTTPLYSLSKKVASRKVGQITEDFIEESRRDLFKQKENMNKER